MTDSFTANIGLVTQSTGSNIGTWGTEQTNLDFTPTDSVLGATLGLTLGSGTLNLTQTQRQNLAYLLTGTLTGNVTITLPLNFVTSPTVACGGVFIFNNQTTGSHTVTVKTVVSGSTGVTVPQGYRALLYSDQTNVYYANDGGNSFASHFPTYAGDPNGIVSGVVGDALWDTVDNILWICEGGTVWAGGGAVNVSNATGVLPIAHGGTGQTTAPLARSSAGLNIDEMTLTSGNASYSILTTDRSVGTTATAMTGDNTWTLPAANTMTPGQQVLVVDINGVVGTHKITIARSASDTINGATSIAITSQYGGYLFTSDGVSKWSVQLWSSTGGAPLGYTASNGIVLVGMDFEIDTTTVNGIGSYAFLRYTGSVLLANGSTTSGANLAFLGTGTLGGPDLTYNGIQSFGVSPSGTWRNISGLTLYGTLADTNQPSGGMFIRTA